MSETFKIRTSCGAAFEMSPDEMSVRQLQGLIDGNADHPAVSILRAELARRQAARTA